ncbi:polymorphic toxin-type HINT domain-containing protein [Ruminococcus flavefaciens]|uniref:fibronectin type III domain-containing protein n=1 Tax=Ruminococcus flavefaciens TaxID=1265 RepID=UPI0026EB63E5|nr:polymorphic toxin-type HINT domain-containing protein [Ruminococcus flavefaciens]
MILNGGTLDVKGDYRIQSKTVNDENETTYGYSTGYLVMTNDKDKVNVDGNFITSSNQDHSKCLTAGTLTIGGNFTQNNNNGYNFHASGSHTVAFSGNKEHTIYFANQYRSTDSCFSKLAVGNETLVIAEGRRAPVVTEVTEEKGTVKGYIDICGATKIPSEFKGSIRVIEDRTFGSKLHITGSFVNEVSVTFNEDFTCDGNLNMSSYMAINKCEVACGGSFTGEYYGRLFMNEAESVLRVKGNYTFGSSYNSSGINNGTIYIGGNCTINVNQFIAADANTVVFDGETKQTVTVNAAGARFGKVVFDNASKEGVDITTVIYLNEVDNSKGCIVKTVDNGEFGHKLTADEIIDSDYLLGMGTLDLNGHKLTVNGNLIQAGGKVILNGGTLDVKGDYRIQSKTVNDENETTYGYSTGYLVMTNDKDKVNVDGNFITSSNQDHSKCLTSGEFSVKGNFTVNDNSYNNFIASGANKIIFCGDQEQKVNFNHSNVVLQNVEFANKKNISINGNTARVDGTLKDSTYHMSGSAYLRISRWSQIGGDKFTGNIDMYGGSEADYKLQNDISLGNLSVSYMDLNGFRANVRNITVNNRLTMSSGTMECSGNFNVGYYSVLSMDNELAYLWVGGDFVYGSQYSSADYLKTGTIEVKGDFRQTSGIFKTGEKFVVLLSGNSFEDRVKYQTISFTNPGSSKFANLKITKPIGQYRFIGNDSKEANAELFYDNLITDYTDTVAPSDVASFAATEIKTTSIRLAWDEATDDNAVMGYEIYRDDVRVYTGGNITNFIDSGLAPETVYEYQIYAFDDCRNYSKKAAKLSVKTLPDTEAPTVPQNIKVQSRTGSSVLVTWNPSTDNVKVASYSVYCNDKLIGTTNNTNYNFTKLDAEQKYSFKVTASDAANNTSDFSDSTVGIPMMPEIISVSPEDYSEIGGKTVTLTAKYADSGNSTGNSVMFEYKKSGEGDAVYKKIQQFNSAQERYSANTLCSKCKWDLEGMNGNFDVRVTLIDSEGNTSVKTVSYTVDTTGPAAPEELSAAGENGAVVLEWKSSKSANCNGYNIYRAPADSDKFELVKFVQDVKTVRYVDHGVTEGNKYIYKIAAVSKFNIEGDPCKAVTVSVNKDEEPPRVVSITPSKSKVNKSALVHIKAEDNIGVDSIALSYKEAEGTEWKDIEEKKIEGDQVTIKWDTTSVPDGAYLVRAIAKDKNGNASEDFTKAYVVDNAGPSQVKMLTDECTSASSFVSLRWEDISDEDFGYYVVECKNEKGEFTEAGRTSDTAGMHITDLMSETEYTFRVVAYDELGNRGTASETFAIKTQKDEIAPAIKRFLPTDSVFSTKIPLSISAEDNIKLKSLALSYSYDNTDEKKWTEIAVLDSKSSSKTDTFGYDFDVTKLPEGEIFIKAEITDASGNAGNACISTYKIDRTAPAAVTELKAAGSNGNVHLTWRVSDDDIKQFEIYRAEEGKSKYSLLTVSTTKDFYDVNVEYGGVYTYQVAAVDIAGNKSELSNEAIAQVMPDTEAPKIYGFGDKDGSVLPVSPKMCVAVSDNSRLASVAVSYRKKTAADDTWLDIETISLKSNYEVAEFDWDTSGLENGEYQLRAIAADEAGNICEPYTATFTLKNDPPEVPVISLTQGNFEISVNWSESKSDDLKGYRLYRRAEGETEFTVIGEANKLSYTDKNVVPLKKYTYKVEAWDKYDNHSMSEEKTTFAYDEDDEAPVINVSPLYYALTDHELQLDATDSTDNVRIVSFEWDMGNGEKVYGGRTTYKYNKAGTYKATLTAKDDAENCTTADIEIIVTDPQNTGSITIQAVDEKRNPIPYAWVYLSSADGKSEKTLKADYNGMITITEKIGNYKVSVYKDSYLPEKKTIEITKTGSNGTVNVQLSKGELVSGNLTVHRMSLQEMIEAGIDFNDPSNFHSYTFTVELTFAQEPIPTVIEYVGGGGGGFGRGGGGGGFGGWDCDLGDGSHVHIEPIIPNTPTEEEEVLPILAYVRTSETISFMKEMYSVDLGVINNATSEFVIKDCSARLNLPYGLSLAATTTGKNTIVQSMGDIAGQESKSVSWAVRGDKKGKYTVSADFSGTLTPFNVPVNATFKTANEFEVGVGRGLHLYIYPEEVGYIGKDYYIQYELKNEGSEPLYNVKTSFGKYKNPGYEQDITVYNPDGTVEKLDASEVNVDSYYIENANECQKIPITYGSQSIEVGVLMPGDVLYGTYETVFSGEGDPEKVRYRLIESLVKGLEETDVQVTVCPIPSHINKYNIKVKVIPQVWADPVDMTTGAFTDTVSALSVQGAFSPLDFNLNYNSLVCDKRCTTGYGWNNDYESYLEFKGNAIDMHWNASNYATFIRSDAVVRTVSGQLINKSSIKPIGDPGGFAEFLPISHGMQEYHFYREKDGTYTLVKPDKSKLRFDAEGRLTQIISSQDQTISITRNGNVTTVTEDMSGAKLQITYSEDGLVTSVSDGKGRTAYLTYEDGRLKTVKNPLGEVVTFDYDDSNRVIAATNSGAKTPYVKNEYNDDNRVVKQYDALGNVTSFKYTDDDKNQLTTVCTDRNGKNIVFVSDGMGRVSSITDANGHATKYTYDTRGNLIAETNSKGNARRYEYDDKDQLVKTYDYDGNVTTMTYDSKGNVTSVKGPDGELNKYVYNPHNLLASSVENSGAARSYTYNEAGQMLTETVEGLGTTTYGYTNGRITSITDPLGNKKLITYDEFGNLRTETDRDGNKTVYTYDALGRSTGVSNSDGTVSYTYDAMGNKTSVTDAKGNVTHMYYDGNNQIIKTVDANKAATLFEYDKEGRLLKTTYADGTTEVNTYDPAGKLLTNKNANGELVKYTYDETDLLVSETTVGGDEQDKLSNAHTVSYTYYPDGKVKTITYPDKTTESYIYDHAGRVLSVTDSEGNAKTMTYDGNGNLLTSSDELGNTVTYTYDKYGRVTSMTDANGNKTTYDKYDANGNCLKLTYPNGLSVSYEYNKEGKVIKASKGSTSVSYEYDAAGRVTKYTDEANHTYTTVYDANGNVEKLLDPDGNVLQENKYDAVNNLILETDPMGIQTQYDYNNVGQIKTMIDNLNTSREKKTTYEYDKTGRLISSTDAAGGVSKNEYDAFGNVTAMTDPNGGRTTYSYDSMGRVISTLNAVGSKLTNTYNAAGMLSESKNARGQKTSYTYYKNGWLESVTDELGTVSYKYDGNGNVISVKDSNGTITRKYNELNLVTEVTDFRGNTVKYSYDELGNLVTLTYPGGRIVRYTYLKDGRVNTVKDWDNNITAYEYDSNGRVTKITRPDGSVETRGYDKAGRLVKQVDINGDKVINARDYAYDDAGNITSSSMVYGHDLNGLKSAEMKYDSANRLIEFNGEKVKYDADGNMVYGPVNGKMTELVYDCRNRLVSAGGVSYEYDAENNRISKTSGNVKTSFVVDTSGELSRVLTAETSGKKTSFVYGIGLISQQTDTETLFYHFNNIGNTEAVTNLSGTIVATFAYGPYGELKSPNKYGIMFLFNGEYGVSTDENNLCYMRARYYNPEIKRFINQDVVIGSIDNSPSLNRYAYVQGNPISYVDPFGLSPGLGWDFWGHMALSLLGNLMAIPTPITMIIGAAAIIANTAWYASEGDYFGAITSAVSVFGCGFQALSAAKAAGAVSISCKFITGLKYASCVSDIALGAYDIYQVGKNVYDLASRGELTLGAVLGSTFQVVMDAVQIGGGINGLSEKVSYCFVEGTPVETEDGQKPIEEIKEGDMVLSEDPTTGEVAYKTVLKTYENETTELVHVHVNGDEIKATPSHYFYSVQFGWTKAADLRAGDVLVLVNGESVVVEWVEHEILESPVKVYNFEVEDFHTYFVGDSGVLVHNMCGTDDKKFDEWLNDDRYGDDYKVYFGVKNNEYQYTGITKQTLDERLYQHNYQTPATSKKVHQSKNFSNLEGQANGLTKNQARALEQYYIENGPNALNSINSVRPAHRFHDKAMKWAEEYIAAHGMKTFKGGDFKVR